MTAYEQQELAAAKQEQIAQEAHDAKVKAEEEHDMACYEFAWNAIDDGQRWSELLDAYHNTTDAKDWPIFYDHLRQMMNCDKGSQEWAFHLNPVLTALARAADLECLLEGQE